MMGAVSAGFPGEMTLNQPAAVGGAVAMGQSRGGCPSSARPDTVSRDIPRTRQPRCAKLRKRTEVHPKWAERMGQGL